MLEAWEVEETLREIEGFREMLKGCFPARGVKRGKHTV
jgi:hypothetical protein